MKVSQMIIEFAGDYIELGDDLNKKQSYLNAACTAWNISLLPKSKQKKEIKKCLLEYKKSNPQVKDTKNLKHDLNLLIKSKENLFPNETRKIASARILDAGDEFKIIAAFFD